MSSERGLWSTMQSHVYPFGLFKRIENSTDLGTPDVCYQLRIPKAPVCGWLELKEEVWPARNSTPLRINSLTREQVIWQEEWERAGGIVATLAQVGRDYIFMKPTVLRLVFKRQLTRADLVEHRLSTGEFPTTFLLKRLMR